MKPLVVSNAMLHELVAYLLAVHEREFEPGKLAAAIAKLRVVHDPHQDDLNREDPRAFCYVRDDKPHVIYATRYLDALPDVYLLGVLYHEIGHLVLGAFKTGEDEPRVDAWCQAFAPELKYNYGSVKYPGPRGDARAMNLQRITLPKPK